LIYSNCDYQNVLNQLKREVIYSEEDLANCKEKSVTHLRDYIAREKSEDLTEFDWQNMCFIKNKVYTQNYIKYAKHKFLYHLKYEFYRTILNFVPKKMKNELKAKKIKYKQILEIIREYKN
jgi:hypothetical protein